MIRKELETMLSIKDDYCGKKIIIWGTGNTTSLYQEGFNRLECEPKMAICIYHNCVDLYSIMLLIKEINKNYKFAVRHYTHMLSDTVLYVY